MRAHFFTLLVVGLVTLLSAAAFIAPAMSESTPPPPPPPTTAAAWQVVRSTAPEPSAPDAATLLILVRTSLLTLNDAIRTGNFTVLRDTAAPKFREANSAARLSMIFAKAVDGRVDLSPAAVMLPQLTSSPVIDAKGMLQIRGYYDFPTERIDFTVIYEAGPSGWRIYGISVNPAPMVQAAAQPPAAPKTAALAPTRQAAPAGFVTYVNKTK